MKEIREIIKELRIDHDLTQKAVAAYLGVTQQCYFNYESGRCAVPTWVVIALAKLYRVSTDYLLEMDTSYLCSMNLTNIYINNVTLYQVLYDIQKVRKNKREELLHYIRFLSGQDQ